MIKITVIVLLCVVTFVACEETYTTKWDNIDIDSILKSDRLLKNYVNCLLDKGRCTPDGAELKSKKYSNGVNIHFSIYEFIPVVILA